jgi:hypothetical protein
MAVKQLVFIMTVLLAATMSAAQAQSVPSVSPRPETEGENKLLEVLFDNTSDLNAANTKLLQDLVSKKLQHGIARSQAAVDAIAQTQRVIAWNNKASTISFALAHVALLLAVAGSLTELVYAYRLRRRGQSIDDIEITLKLEAIAVKTTSIGVMLIVGAIFLYFLYLRYVYPVQVVPL